MPEGLEKPVVFIMKCKIRLTLWATLALTAIADAELNPALLHLGPTR